MNWSFVKPHIIWNIVCYLNLYLGWWLLGVTAKRRRLLYCRRILTYCWRLPKKHHKNLYKLTCKKTHVRWKILNSQKQIWKSMFGCWPNICRDTDQIYNIFLSVIFQFMSLDIKKIFLLKYASMRIELIRRDLNYIYAIIST